MGGVNGHYFLEHLTPVSDLMNEPRNLRVQGQRYHKARGLGHDNLYCP